MSFRTVRIALILPALLLCSCMQTALLRIENHSRRNVVFYGPGQDVVLIPDDQPPYKGTWYHVVLPGTTADAIYHTIKTTGVVLPFIGGIKSEEGGHTRLFHHGEDTLDLPKEDQWPEPTRWAGRGIYYRMTHPRLGTLIFHDKPRDCVLLTPSGVRLPIQRRKD